MADSPEQQVGFDPDAYPGERATGSKENGNAAERWVRETYDLDPQDPDQFPESSHDAVDPRTNTPIEIKSCQIYYNGNGSRGRFQIWDYAHQDLLDHDGAYIFVVQEPRTEEFHVYFHRPLSAEAVDELIGNWHPIDHSLRPSEAQRTSLGQSAVFTDIQISRTEPHSERGGTDADAETGEASQKQTVNEIIEAIRDIEAQQENQNGAPHGAVVQRVVEATGRDPDAIEHQIQELRKRGEIYSPRKDHHRVTSDA